MRCGKISRNWSDDEADHCLRYRPPDRAGIGRRTPTFPLLFSEVIIPSSVLVEATLDQQKPCASRIASALQSPGFREYPGRLTGDFQALADLLDIGEAEALSIARELGAIALIDGQRGRKVAVNRGVAVTGTAGVLVMAKRRGEIRAVKPLLEEMAMRCYRFSEKLVSDVLDICGE